jgi:hypothetical protein
MRLIENYNTDAITKDFILTNEWDVIKLNKKIDVKKLREWYFSVSKNLEHLKFNFRTCTKYIKESVNNKFTTDTNNYQWILKNEYMLLQNSYSLTWFNKQDVPLPPAWAANLDYFPELRIYYNDAGDLIKDFNYLNNIYLNQYMFGEWENITKWLTPYIFNPRITEHLTGHVIPLHTDGYMARLHIPMTIDNSKFYWGENYDREYKFEPGSIYLINTKIIHGTTNFGPTTRANIIADIHEDKIFDILKL